PEKRLITIDAETVERVRACVDRRRPLAARWQCGVDAAWSILAAWEEGVEIPDPARSQSPTCFVAVWMSEGEAQHCLDVLRELAENPDIEWPERVFSLFEYAVEEESRRTFEQMLAEREIA